MDRRWAAALIATLALLAAGEATLGYRAWRTASPAQQEVSGIDATTMRASLYPEEATSNLSERIDRQDNEIKAAAQEAHVAFALTNSATAQAEAAGATAAEAKVGAERANRQFYELCQINSICLPSN